MPALIGYWFKRQSYFVLEENGTYIIRGCKRRNSLFYAAPSYIKYNPVILGGKEYKAKLMPFTLIE